MNQSCLAWIPCCAALTVFLALPACGGGDEPTSTGGAKVSAEGQPLRLKADPGNARSVMEVRALEPSGDEVVVYGRVSSIVPGVAVFTLIDEGLDYCGRGADKMDGCPTPWDYCCIDGEKKAANTLGVEARDAQKNAIADRLEDLRHLDLVVAKGKLERDENGNSTIVASGWFRKERPALSESLDWPVR